MGVDVVLYRAVGAGPGRGRVSYVPAEVLPDPDDVLLDLIRRVRGGGRTPLLDRVDPVGLLVVSADRTPQLLAELRCLAEVARTNPEMTHVRRLDRLARRCRQDREMEIRFEGD
ncbi:hypothetical protein NCC78_29490 [Micromonospora phytophila]|uniref:hypothetical protein n=1 Tax=Micromonospora phytophila TaxID=709888 RepID=UPI00202E24D0|nr:hypothetical protein [Micromonospora phytophila]MCM0678778.1 hypothetical protein [Micromonospora phytophila]